MSTCEKCNIPSPLHAYACPDKDRELRAECMGTVPHPEHNFNGGMWCPGLPEPVMERTWRYCRECSLPDPLHEHGCPDDKDAEDNRVTVYVMNPAEDDVLFGDELEDGMLVLPEFAPLRHAYRGDGKDEIRAEQFREVTNLRRTGKLVVFTGRWPDGYAEVHNYHALMHGWLVKRPVTEEAAHDQPGA